MYRPCLFSKAPIAAIVLRPEVVDVLCTSNIVFLDRSTPQITSD